MVFFLINYFFFFFLSLYYFNIKYYLIKNYNCGFFFNFFFIINNFFVKNINKLVGDSIHFLSQLKSNSTVLRRPWHKHISWKSEINAFFEDNLISLSEDKKIFFLHLRDWDRHTPANFLAKNVINKFSEPLMLNFFLFLNLIPINKIYDEEEEQVEFFYYFKEKKLYYFSIDNDFNFYFFCFGQSINNSNNFIFTLCIYNYFNNQNFYNYPIEDDDTIDLIDINNKILYINDENFEFEINSYFFYRYLLMNFFFYTPSFKINFLLSVVGFSYLNNFNTSNLILNSLFYKSIFLSNNKYWSCKDILYDIFNSKFNYIQNDDILYDNILYDNIFYNNIYNNNIYNNLLIEDFMLQSYFNYNINKLIHIKFKATEENFLTFIFRIRFKPGYKKQWISGRHNFKNIYNLSFMSQKHLTHYLANLKNLYDVSFLKYFEFQLKFLLVKSKFFFSLEYSIFYIVNGLVYINGLICKNTKYILFKYDHIQLIFSYNFFIFYRWMKNWSHKRLKKLYSNYYFPLSYKKSILPKWFFLYINFNDDVPQFLEIDFFSLSIFIIFEPQSLNNFNWFLSKYFYIFSQKTLNWKYLV